MFAKEGRRDRVAALDARIGQLCANVDAALAELMGALREFDDLGAWSDQHARSPEHWLCWRANVSPRAAKQWFSLARTLEDLPKIHAAINNGDLTYWQTEIIATVATEETQDILIDLASHSTAAQLQRICVAFKGARRAQSETSTGRHEDRTLGYHYEDEGFMHVYARLCPEDAAIFEKAIEATAARLKEEQEDDTCTKRSHGQRYADALIDIAQRSLTSDGDSGSSNYEVMVHVDLGTLAGGSGEGARIDGGPAIPRETIDRIMCDSFIRHVVERDGKVVDVGARRRHPTKRQRRALEVRDEMCRFPGCNAKRYRDAHHLDLYWEGGETRPDRLVLLCSFHHRLLHAGRFRIEGDVNDKLTFYDSEGKVIENVVPRPSGEVDDDLDSETCRSGWDGVPIDLAACVDAIFATPGRDASEPEARPRGP
jgi:hypothetical protein